MIDALLPIFVKAALLFLRRWMDARVATWGEAGATDSRLKAIEDELFALIEKAADSPAGKALLKSIVKAVVDARFRNDPDAATFG